MDTLPQLQSKAECWVVERYVLEGQMVRAEGRELPGAPSGRQNPQGLAFGGSVWGGRNGRDGAVRAEAGVETSVTVLGSGPFNGYVFGSRERGSR